MGSTVWKATQLVALFCALLTKPVLAGTNAGFSVVVDPAEIRGPAVGERIDLAVEIQGTVEANHALLVARYDSSLFSFVEFAPGDLLEGLVAPPGIPEAVDGGLLEIQSGGTQLGGPPGVGSGLLGTLSFELRSQLPAEGAFISLTQIQLNASVNDADTLSYAVGEFGVRLIRVFANRLFNIAVKRRHDGANLSWQSRWPGIDDTLRYRAVGDSVWTEITNPLRTNGIVADIAAVKTLQAAGIEAESATIAVMDAVLATSLSTERAALLAELDIALRNRSHSFVLTGLPANTQYEYEIRSISLAGRFSPVESGLFRTRLAPDLRAAVGTDLDIQSTPMAATATWFTNRPADTRFAVALIDEDFAEDVAVFDGTGSLVHLASVEDLLLGTQYKYRVTSRLVDVDDLITQGLMTEEQAIIIKLGTFRTKKEDVPLRFLGPPQRVISADGAIINFRLNQLAGALVDYGLVREGPEGEEVIYDWSAASGDVLNAHSLTLAGLNSSSTYRYRIRVVSLAGDTLSTGPDGNDQWSRDLKLRTSAAGDTLPPVIIEGPVVVIRDVLAVVRFATDVETKATVFFGTSGGTYGTPDEFEIVDRTADGALRFTREHSIIISGLESGTAYEYGIEVTGANGKTTSFEPSLASAKRAKTLQPPGGAGAFTTDNVPDTQFPVILSGPTVTSKTHDTAIIEWETDEPATSVVEFGTSARDEETSSGTNTFKHKLTLSNLAAGATYKYIVGSSDAVGNGSTQSAEAVFSTNPDLDLTAPIMITQPTAIYKNDRSATIQWRTDEDATGVVEFGPTAELGFIRELPTTGQVHEISLNNLIAATTYYVQVSSSDLSNNGPTTSQLLEFSTDAMADLLPPVITDIRAVAADSAAIITWNTDELADSFIEFGFDKALFDFTVGDTKDLTAHEMTLTNLQPATTYFYIVGSVDRANNRPTESDTLGFTTLAEADTTAPSAPFALAATIGNRQVLLAWDAALELDLNGFNVYRRVGTADFALIGSGIRDNNFADLNVSNDAAYEYQVTAIDRQNPPNESTVSASVAATPTSSAAPTTPIELSRSGEVLSPTLVFANARPFNTGATLTYTIQVSTQANFSNATASISGLAEGAGDAGTGQTAWTIDRKLSEGATYYWRVRAVEGSLVGAFSATEEFAVLSVALVGDFNGDGSVLFDDFFLFVDFFGSTADGAAAAFDLDGDGTVSLGDFFAFADNFGKTAAGKRWAASGQIDAEVRFGLEALGGTRAEQRRITVRIWADGAEALKAYGAALQYDPSQVVFEGARPGVGALLESQGGHAPLFSVLYQRPGQLVVGNGLTEGEAVSGRGLLAELDFRLLGADSEAVFDLSEGYVASSGEVVRAVAQLGSARLLPHQYALFANFPNPFNPSTSIEYALPEAAIVELSIYDILGQRVRTLVSGQQGAGFYRLAWDGRDQADQAVASGVYFYRLATAGFSQTRKMTLLK